MLLGLAEKTVRERRISLGVEEAWAPVPVSGVEDAAYYYSTYNGEDMVPVSDRKKIMVIGGGPNRIGQGIEFDYCCVHAAFAIKEAGYESIMVNCNPETVSTDYDTSDKLYFEPLTVEDVLSIYKKEKPEGVVIQFGGQTPLNIARDLADAGVNIVGTSPDTIDLAEDRDRFRNIMRKLGIPMAESGMASTMEEAKEIAERIGYPLMVRPSYVLGGRGMEVVQDEAMLKNYIRMAAEISPERPVLIDRFLDNAIEAEADAICDGHDAFVPAVMEHIELAGIHSGDSACVIPPISIPPKHIDTIGEYTRKIAIEMNVVGLMNIQYAIHENTVYVLEANPRASRTVPIVSKVCGLSMARLATRIMLGEKAVRPEPGKPANPPFRGQGIGVSVQHASRGRSRAGAGNAIHGRSPGDVALVRPGIFQGPGSRSGHASPGRLGAVHHRGPGQEGGHRTGPAVPGSGIQNSHNGRNPHVFKRTRHRNRTGRQARLRTSGSGGRHQKRRSGPFGQHPQRKKKPRGQFQHPQGRNQIQNSLHHHDGCGHRGGERHRSQEKRRAQGALAPSVSPRGLQMIATGI